MAARWLFLVCAGVLLYSAETQESYDALSVNFRNGVDLALEQLRSHSMVQNHFRFFRSLQTSTTEVGFGVTFFFHNFYLRPTNCPKGTTHNSPERCPFKTNRPLMDCTVCYKAAGNQIEPHPKPYVDCIQKPKLTKKMTEARVEHCKRMNYNSGAPTLLAVSSR